MSMFCYQCQETARNQGCNMLRGVCGKTDVVANLQDLLIWVTKGLAWVTKRNRELGGDTEGVADYIQHNLFATITNANFDGPWFISRIKETIKMRDGIRASYLKTYRDKNGVDFVQRMPEAATWSSYHEQEMHEKALTVGLLTDKPEDVKSLKHLVQFGVKGICAYAHHAAMLEYKDPKVNDFLIDILADLLEDSDDVAAWLSKTMETGNIAVQTMALLDKANTETFGNPEPTHVSLGVRNNPGILVSGHDLRDFDELLKQTEGTGIDIYTHSEMLPAHYYPHFKKYKHFVGNYGSSWWHQHEDFESFNGPVLLTTNCLIPPKDSYKHRVFTTGAVGYEGLTFIPDRENGKEKDFSALIALAKNCPPPTEIEKGEIVGGFAHHTVLSVAGKVIELIKAGKIKRFVVMAGCDGRHKERDYFTQVAEKLPQDMIILTAGCAKYRYIKLPLGDIEGIPRVLDAGQCNDSYSLAVIALKLKEAFGLEDVNQLPLSFDIAWYEQKAVAVLLALLALGFKNLRLGPTLPAFLSPNVAKVLVEQFGIKQISTADEDVASMINGL